MQLKCTLRALVKFSIQMGFIHLECFSSTSCVTYSLVACFSFSGTVNTITQRRKEHSEKCKISSGKLKPTLMQDQFMNLKSSNQQSLIALMNQNKEHHQDQKFMVTSQRKKLRMNKITKLNHQLIHVASIILLYLKMR